MTDAETNTAATLPTDPRETPGGLWRTAARREYQSDYFPRLTKAGAWVVVVLCAAWFLAGITRVSPNMLWGELSMGRWIVEHGQLPGVDPLLADTATAPNQDTNSLAHWGLYRVYQLGGIEALLVLHALLVTSACGLTMLSLRGRDCSVAWSASGGAFMLLLATPIISFLGLIWIAPVGIALLLWLYPKLKVAFWPLAAIFVTVLIWANLHGSAPLAVVLLAIFAASQSQQAVFGRGELRFEISRQSLRRGWLAAGASLVACFLTPQLLSGGLPSVGFTSLLGDDPLLLRPLELASPLGITFFASLLVCAILLRRSPRSLSASELILAILALTSVLLAQGAILWWAPLWAWIATPHLVAIMASRSTVDEPQLSAPQEGTTMQTMLAMALAFVVMLITPASNHLISGRLRGESRVTTRETPIYLAAEIKRNNLTGRAFAPIEWADYLVWKSGGEMLPLARPGSRQSAIGGWSDYSYLQTGDLIGLNPNRPNWLGVMDFHQLEYLALDLKKQSHLIAAARRSPRADLIYEDQQCVLFRLLPASPVSKKKDSSL